MLRQEEFVQEHVDLEQAFAIDGDEVAVQFEEAPVLQALNWRSKMGRWVGTKLLFKLRAAHLAKLELENELADKALLCSRRQSAERGELAAAYAVDVGIEVVMVLVVDAVHVTETCDADG